MPTFTNNWYPHQMDDLSEKRPYTLKHRSGNGVNIERIAISSNNKSPRRTVGQGTCPSVPARNLSKFVYFFAVFLILEPFFWQNR